jgi:hypothetical protein
LKSSGVRSDRISRPALSSTPGLWTRLVTVSEVKGMIAGSIAILTMQLATRVFDDLNWDDGEEDAG